MTAEFIHKELTHISTPPQMAPRKPATKKALRGKGRETLSENVADHAPPHAPAHDCIIFWPWYIPANAEGRVFGRTQK